MLRITRDDIQRIGDEATLLHFLEEKLNLPIPEGLTLEDITIKFAKFALGLSGAVANQVLDCQELSVLPGKPSGIFLIRFDSESGYAETLRAIAESLDRPGRNPASLRFICMNEYCQPFAFAYFNSSQSKDWQSAVLNIRAWTQENTHIHTSSEHELPRGFFSVSEDGGNPLGKNVPPDEPEKNREISPPEDQGSVSQSSRESTSPDGLLTKLENIGTPLGQQAEIHSGHRIQPGCKDAFVLGKSKYQQLVNADPKSKELIKPVVRTLPESRWKPERKHLILIFSSEFFKEWPWSDANNETKAEQIFSKTYPVISKHLYNYRNRLKDRAASSKGKFYWELPTCEPTPEQHPEFYQPKIIYHADGMSLSAGYDKSGSFILGNYTPFIPTEDLSLLAILNSKLFHFYAKAKFQAEFKRVMPENYLTFKKENMVTFPIANRTKTQKAELSDLVQQILDAPNSPAVPALEEEINMLVYDLYQLTAVEIALIEEETNK